MSSHDLWAERVNCIAEVEIPALPERTRPAFFLCMCIRWSGIQHFQTPLNSYSAHLPSGARLCLLLLSNSRVTCSKQVRISVQKSFPITPLPQSRQHCVQAYGLAGRETFPSVLFAYTVLSVGEKYRLFPHSLYSCYSSIVARA